MISSLVEFLHSLLRLDSSCCLAAELLILGIEYLFIVGSAGGGTASGILASMKRVAMNDLDLKACPIVTVMPNTKLESVKALINCYETLAEIEKIGDEPGATFILDNDKNSNKLRINEMFFCYLDALLSNQSSSVLGNVDNAEIEELITPELKGGKL